MLAPRPILVAALRRVRARPATPLAMLGAVTVLGVVVFPAHSEDSRRPTHVVHTSTAPIPQPAVVTLRPPAADRSVALPTPIARVQIEERVPTSWLRVDADRLPLEPARWRRRLPRECRTRGGYREHCQGLRDVPEPSGAPAALAAHLGLGHRFTPRILMGGPVLPEWLAIVEDDDRKEALSFPVPGGHLGRGFGKVRGGSIAHRRHLGLDIGAPEGSPIVAARGGVVAYSDDGITGYGNVVIVLHRGGFSTLYAHCKRTLVQAGERVRRGQPIAEVGQTGFTYAPHLHFEWRQQGWVRDPSPRLLADDAPPLGRPVSARVAQLASPARPDRGRRTVLR